MESVLLTKSQNKQSSSPFTNPLSNMAMAACYFIVTYFDFEHFPLGLILAVAKLPPSEYVLIAGELTLVARFQAGFVS